MIGWFFKFQRKGYHERILNRMLWTSQRLQVIFKTEIDGQLLCEIMDAIDRTWLWSSGSECGGARPSSSRRTGIENSTICAATFSEASLPSVPEGSTSESSSPADTPPIPGSDNRSRQLLLTHDELPLSERPLDSPQIKNGLPEKSRDQLLHENGEQESRDGQSETNRGDPLLLSSAARQINGEPQHALECVDHLQELSREGSSARIPSLEDEAQGRRDSSHDADRIAHILESLTHGGRFVLARQLLGAKGRATAESLFIKLQAASDGALLSGAVSVPNLRQLYGL